MDVKDVKAEIHPLTVIRFVAAFAVMLFHYAKKLDAPAAVRNFIENGFWGVSLFFILSGFILVYVSHGKPIQVREFLVKRFARIYPVYLVAWMLTAVALLLRPGITLSYFLKCLAAYGVISLSMLQAWIPGIVSHWNWPSWSLSCEMFFYALFPVIFVSLGKLSNRRLWCLLIGIATLSIIKTFVIESQQAIILSSTFLATPLEGYLNDLPALALTTFLLGAIGGELFMRGVRLHPAFAIVSGAAVLGLMMLPRSPAVIAVSIPLLAILIFALANSRARLPKFVVLLGHASYAMYIMQFPLWELIGNNQNAPRTLGGVAAFCATLIAVSIVLHWSVERPAERWIKSRFGARRDPGSRYYAAQPQE